MIGVRKERGSLAWRTLLVGGAAVGLLAFASAADLPTRLVWNASASVPIGLYAVQPDGRYRPGVIVLVQPPEPLAAFLADGGYLPRGVPLLKRVEALPGARVCRNGGTLTGDGRRRAEVRERDRFGRSLPFWTGCVEVAEGQLFLLNADAPGSLDGRYFGPIPASSVVGRAAPLFVRDGR